MLHEPLLGSIYASAADPAIWQDALGQLRDHLGFSYAALAVQSLPCATPLVSATCGIGAAFLPCIAAYGSDYIDRWGGEARVAALPFDEPAVLSQVNPRAKWEQTGWYERWARPQGVFDVMAIGVARGRGSVGSIVFGRHERAGAIGAGELHAARALVPHLQRAVAMNAAVAVQRLLPSAAEALLDSIGHPVLLLDLFGRVVHASRAGEALLARGDLPLDRERRLRLSAPSGAKLDERLAEAAAGSPGAAVTHLPIDGRRGPVAAQVVALGDQALVRVTAPDAVAAILVAGPAGTPAPVARALAVLLGLANGDAALLAGRLARPATTEPAASPGLPARNVAARCARLAAEHGLTPAEQAVAIEAARGDGRNAIATRLSISPSTVRAHLSAIFAKLGIHRQGELVALLFAGEREQAGDGGAASTSR